ncbi:type II toxin-antitoxin system RelE/ParE family toxin [Microcystis wesenbergii FACHB-1317]|jgi:mRNA interferase RelE/StbE|uniref:type II toxin-antitoxin system RelE family toxin n=1 Tax=Microcystis TaxID=1125 RepID=UPI001681AE1F|nr:MULTISPECIES: type II toxin-antitoxin system RelE/ParE family toxin [Microcystis]MBD2288435.1 type II toxin-antitoxin system RelE/ParE family toxin [Microcystis wesenbergii FACHB-1317]MEB3189454.1 type II toxin-antitoxin system RelE/ParE family toxin [Snowella sp.]UZO78640.1 type II toxin-antitoxin system RelE/ParE family toxin [Microcystis aeruginosa str. Chao 1910]
MAYSVKYEPEAVNDLDQLTQTTRIRILKKIEWLKNNFDQISPLSLTGNLSGFYKLRIGDYRVIYEFDKEKYIIYVNRIGHRREIYEE